MYRFIFMFALASFFLGQNTMLHAGVRDQVQEIVTEGQGWTSMPFAPEIVPQSIMDLSHTVDAPAGKQGRIIINADGHFATQNNNQRIRFYGNNLCFSANTLASDTCKNLAMTFRQIGYNAVRFHHFDREITDAQSGDSTILVAEKMDRLDQLFYEMKQQGQYVTIDLFVSRVFAKNEIPGFAKLNPTNFKALMMVNEDAFANWAQFATNLLNHVNPYTGMAWKDDPALFALCMTNENNFTQAYKRSIPRVKQLVDDAFEQYLIDKAQSDVQDEDRKAWRTQFDADMQLQTFEKCATVVRDLGCKAFLTDANMLGQYHMTPARQAMDFVDSHSYWDHPQFPSGKWGLPEKYRNLSGFSETFSVPRTIMGARQFGKPYMVTEFNFTFPNRYRAEAGPVMGAYAALQDWDGMFRFAFAHKDYQVHGGQPMHRFNLANDPIMWLSDRIIIDLFRRHRVEAASKRIAYAVTQTDLRNPESDHWKKGQFDAAFTKLGLAVQIGSYDGRNPENTPENIDAIVSSDGSLGVKIDPRLDENSQIIKALGTAKANLRKGQFESENGTVHLRNWQGEMIVQTPNAVCVILKAGAQQQIGNLHLHNEDNLPAVIYVASHDDLPLDQSKRLLVLHLTDVQNTGSVFKTDKRQLLQEIGHLPLLTRDGIATLSFENQQASTLVAHAIDCSGKRITPVPLTCDGNRVSMTLQTDQQDQAILAYEITVP